MGQKNIVSKSLLRHRSVFADVINLALYNSEPVVTPESLQLADPGSEVLFPGHTNIHEQFRDVSMYCISESAKFYLFGVENQTKQISYFPARTISYDGAAYKEQTTMKDNDSSFIIRPVVSVLLNYSYSRWNKPKSLHEMFGIIPGSAMAGIVSDYKIHVVDLGFLTEEQLHSLSSDFRPIATALRKRCNSKISVSDVLDDYVPVYPDEVARALYALADGDSKMMQVVHNMKGDAPQLEQSLGTLEEYYISQGKKQGIAQERERLTTLWDATRIQQIKSIARTFRISEQEAARVLDVSEEDTVSDSKPSGLSNLHLGS